MFRKSICLSALLALGMVGSSFAQNLSAAAQAQVGSSDASTGSAQAITPQMIHSVPSELVADDSTNGPSSHCRQPRWRRQCHFSAELYPLIHRQRHHIPLHHGWQ